MFELLFFIPTAVFFILAIVFPLAISNVEKMPKAVSLNIGRLNADDIRKLDNNNRNYLRNQVAFHFALAVAVTLLISILFIIFGITDNASLALPCNFVGTVVGLLVALRVLKKADALKEELLHSGLPLN